MSENKTSDKQETPRTDALGKELAHNESFRAEPPNAYGAMFDHARQLERELAESVNDSKAILLENAKLNEELSARGATEQEPIAWRWRNKGGQWWYREDAPANPPAAPLESDAVIEPLYALPWSQYVGEKK